MRQRVGQKKVDKLIEQTGLQITRVMVRGGTGHRKDLHLEDGTIVNAWPGGTYSEGGPNPIHGYDLCYPDPCSIKFIPGAITDDIPYQKGLRWVTFEDENGEVYKEGWVVPQSPKEYDTAAELMEARHGPDGFYANWHKDDKGIWTRNKTIKIRY